MSNLLSQASLVMIPSGYKEDVVYSPIPTNGAGDLSFTRASNGTRVNSAGLVEVCPWNLADDSNGFGGLALITKTTGQVSPIDSTSGNLLTATGSGEHYSGTASLTVVVGNSYTYSVYGKFVQSLQLALRTVFSNGDQDITTIWNLSTGALVSNAGQHTNPTITAVGNGYYRCSMTFTPSVVPAFPLLFRLQMAFNGSTSFSASSGDSFLAYGAQINNGAIASYFPTTDRLNVPRLTYQNGGGGCPSLLLEKQSTNIVLQSQALAGSPWVIQTGSILDNNTISPDGTQNASRLTDITVYEGMSVDIGATYTATMYAKLGTATNICLVINNQAAWNTVGGVSFTTSNGLIANEWARVQYTFTAPSTGAINLHIGGHGQTGVTPQSAGTVFVWGVQVEKSSYPTSYIPTTSSSATRVADACYKTGISSLIGQTEGVIFWDGVINGYSVYNELIPISLFASGATTSGGQMYIRFVATGAINFLLYNGSSIVFNIVTSAIYTLGSRIKVAGAYKNNDFVFYVNGTQIGTSTSGSVVALADLYFDYQPSSNYLGQHTTNEVLLFKTRLTNSQLASLTTI